MKTLVDSGCFVSIVHSKLVVGQNIGGESRIRAFNGEVMLCRGRTRLNVKVGRTKIMVDAIVSDSLFGDTMMLMGIDMINKLGGVTIFGDSVKFGSESETEIRTEREENEAAVGCCVEAEDIKSHLSFGGDQCVETALETTHEVIEDVDFKAVFDGKVWTIEWHWKDDKVPKLKNVTDCYDKNLNGDMREGFEKEIEGGLMREF